MIYLCTALPFEAHPFIKLLSLKRNTTLSLFPYYENENVGLIITGSNPTDSAIALTYLLSNRIPNAKDMLLNVGICGCKNKDLPIGSSYFIHKIKSHETNKTYYPDLLFRHPFGESSIETCSRIIEEKDIPTLTEPLVDMEASSIYRAASYFYKPHQIHIIKVVSDYLEGEKLSPDFVQGLISPYVFTILEWATQISDSVLAKNNGFTMEEEALILQLYEKLHLSVTMQLKLKQLLMYNKSKGNSIENILSDFLKANDVNDLKVKTEGKKYFELLQSYLI